MAKEKPDTKSIKLDDVIGGIAASLQEKTVKLTKDVVSRVTEGGKEKFNIEHFSAKLEEQLELYASRRVHEEIGLNANVDLAAYKEQTKEERAVAQWYLEGESTMNAGKAVAKEFLKKADTIIDGALAPYKKHSAAR